MLVNCRHWLAGYNVEATRLANWIGVLGRLQRIGTSTRQVTETGKLVRRNHQPQECSLGYIHSVQF